MYLSPEADGEMRSTDPRASTEDSEHLPNKAAHSPATRRSQDLLSRWDEAEEGVRKQRQMNHEEWHLRI